MELLNVVRARSLWFFEPRELNPRGKSIDLIERLKDDYRFTKVPSSKNDLDDTKALAFLGGAFQIKEETLIDVDLRIYNDGVVADTGSSTTDTDAFIQDVLTRVAQEFGLTYRPNIVRMKRYLNEMNVRCEQNLSVLNPKLNLIADRLASMLGMPNQSPIEVYAIGWASEPMMRDLIAPFRFERKINAPFSENRYYTQAPIHTDGHLELLNELEAILSGA